MKCTKRALYVSLLFAPAAVAAALLACGPKDPPRQASTSETPDPTQESSSGSGQSGGSSTSGKSGGSGGGGGDNLASPPGHGGKPAKGEKGEPPHVSSLASFMDGLKWGMSHADVTKMFTETGGVIWKDYDERLAKARVGPEQTALEAEREQAKGAFARSYIEFKDTPTGYDATGIKGEYSYKNKESLMWVQRQGKKRYFFFINDRLWKIYDEVPLAENGPYGKAYIEAVNKINGQVGAQGRVQGPNPEKGIRASTVDWKDGGSHLRAVDRSGDRVVAIVIEDNGTLASLPTLRANKVGDPTEIDPSIAAVTGGQNRSDPNAAAAADAGPAASGKKGATPPPGKKK
jgi:hypothetical protein